MLDRSQTIDTLLAPPGATPTRDVTPRRLITGLITERGVTPASNDGLRALFPEHAGALP